MVDPDKGVNSRRKLAKIQGSSSCLKLLQSVPDAEDSQWTSRLYHLPKIIFRTIYEHLVDRKIILHKVSYLEGISDKRAETVQHPGENIVQVVMKVILFQLNIQGLWIKRIAFFKTAMFKILSIIPCLKHPTMFVFLQLSYHQ